MVVKYVSPVPLSKIFQVRSSHVSLMHRYRLFVLSISDPFEIRRKLISPNIHTELQLGVDARSAFAFVKIDVCGKRLFGDRPAEGGETKAQDRNASARAAHHLSSSRKLHEVRISPIGRWPFSRVSV